MENEDRILQILTEMKQDITGLKQDMTEVKQDITSLRDHIDTQTLRLDLVIENNIGKRLDAVSEGYMLNKEKHELLERRVDSVEVRIGRLEIAAS